MTRRKAMLALVAGITAAFAGKRVSSEDTFTWQEKEILDENNTVRWDMDRIGTVELTKGGETITISTAEIFEALREK